MSNPPDKIHAREIEQSHWQLATSLQFARFGLLSTLSPDSSTPSITVILTHVAHSILIPGTTHGGVKPLTYRTRLQAGRWVR